MPVPDGGLIDRDYAKDAVGWAGKDSKDALFDDMIVAATPLLERICGPILPRPRTVSLNGGKSAVVLDDHLLPDNAITAVLESGSATTDYYFDGESGIVYAGTYDQPRTFAAGRKNIKVTYAAGYVTVPRPIKLAARALVKIWFQQDFASGRPSFDDAGQSDSFTVPQGFAVPRKVRELCGPYQRPAGFA